MIEQKVSELNRYFDEKIAVCGQRGGELLADGRTDEASFEKVRANVYDIYRTVLSVALKTCNEDSDAIQRFFSQKARQIPWNWIAAYERARQHNDAVIMQIEQIKLDTISEIRDRFAEIWEGEE